MTNDHFYLSLSSVEVEDETATAAHSESLPNLIVAAYAGGELVGLARATFDGLSAHVMEFSSAFHQ